MTETAPRRRIPAPTVINALWNQGEGRRLAGILAEYGVQALVVGGPELHRRLHGTPASPSRSELELVLRPGDSVRCQTAMEADGYRLHLGSPLFWRWTGTVMYTRNGHVVRLRWRTLLEPVAAPWFRRLRRELWRGARIGASGFMEPRAEPLLVYLAASAGRRSGSDDRGQALADVAAAKAMVTDRGVARSIARSCHASRRVAAALRAATPGDEPERTPVRRVRGIAASVEIGRSIATLLRQWIFEHASYRRQGLRPFRPRKGPTHLGELELEWWEGVCGPGTWSDDLIELWLRSAHGSGSVLVEVGTGTAALAIAASRRAPDVEFHVTDISFRAARNARANARNHKVPLQVYRGDMLEPLPASLRGRVSGVIAHLPSLWLGGYPDPDGVKETVWAPRETYEGPGGDGLALVRRFIEEARPWLAHDGSVVVSMQDWQWDLLEADAFALGYREIDIVRPSRTGVIVMLGHDSSR